MMYGWDGSWGVGGWIAMALMMLLFWGGIVTVMILLVHGPRHAGWGTHEQLGTTPNASSTNGSPAGKSTSRS